MSSAANFICFSGRYWRNVAAMNAKANTVDRRDARADFDYGIADRLTTLRKRVKVTQKMLAAEIGITESSMSEKMDTGPWLAWEIAKLAPVVHSTVPVLYGIEPMPEPTRPATVTKIDPSKNADRRTQT